MGAEVKPANTGGATVPTAQDNTGRQTDDTHRDLHTVEDRKQEKQCQYLQNKRSQMKR